MTDDINKFIRGAIGLVVAVAICVSVAFWAAVAGRQNATTTGPLDPSIKAIRFADDYAVILTDKPCKDGSQWKQAIAAKQPMSQASISYSGCYYTNSAGQTKMLWNLATPDAALSQSLPTNLNPL